MSRTTYPPTFFLLLFVLLATSGPGARAEVQFLASERTATIDAAASQYCRCEEDTYVIEDCNDQQSWTDTTALADHVLLCSVSPGYGFARSRVRIPSSTVSEIGFSTQASVNGDVFQDGWLGAGGEFVSTYRQVYEFRVVDQGLLQLTGTLGLTSGSRAELTIWRAEVAIVHFEAPAIPPYYAEEPSRLDLDEDIPLGAGDYRCLLDLEGRQVPQGFAKSGGAFATILAVLAETVSVEPTTWGRIKTLYR